jgi:uncharacterized protein YjeT (DUF2065 family)
MDTVIKIIGLIIAGIGLVYLIRPDVLRKVLSFFKKRLLLYIGALLRFALGVVFLLAARECDVMWVIALFGILFLISGLMPFLLGGSRSTSILSRAAEQPAVVLRVVGSIVVVVGLIIVYAA